MSDLSTYAKFRDWLLAALVAAVLSLAALVFNTDRGRIEKLEALLEERGERIDAQGARIGVLEASRVNEREEILRRLARIENKIDKSAP